MTNVACPSVRPFRRAPLSRSHDDRSRRGHGERCRISTRLSSCNSHEFIMERAGKEVRVHTFVRRLVRSFVRNIEFQCGGSPPNLSASVIEVGRVGQGLIHSGRSVAGRSVGLVKQYSGAYGSISDSAHSTSVAVSNAAGSLCNSSTLALIPSCAQPRCRPAALPPSQEEIANGASLTSI